MEHSGYVSVRGLMRALAIPVALSAIAAKGCYDSTPPAVGALKVYTGIQAAGRAVADTDGVDVIIDGGAPVHVAAAGDSVIRDPIATGIHTIEVQDVRSTCTLSGPNPTSVPVARDSTSGVILFGTCQ